MKSIIATTTVALSVSSVSAFAPNSQGSRASMQLNGLFDGMKDAFGAPALDRSKIDSERETPIDRWMGWNVQSEEETMSVAAGMYCDCIFNKKRSHFDVDLDEIRHMLYFSH